VSDDFTYQVVQCYSELHSCSLGIAMVVAVFLIGLCNARKGGSSAPGPPVFLMGMVDDR
jgi:hypothetical protein